MAKRWPYSASPLPRGAPRNRLAERRQRTFRRQRRKVPSLGSELNVLLPLAQVEQCLLDDRERRYALRPVLLETFCESLAGTRAAN